MIRPARECRELSDDAFAELIEPNHQEIKRYVNNELIYDFFAFCIASSFNNDALWEDYKLEYEYTDAVEYLSNLPKFEELDIDKFKKILEKKHSLKLTNADPIRIEEIH